MTPKLKVALSIIKYVFVSLALLFFLLVAIVNLPFVHSLITQKANSIFAEKGIPIRTGKITLLLNGKIGLQNFEIITPATDTIVYAGKASVGIRLLPLLKKRVIVRNIYFENVVANIIADEQTGKLNIISLFSKNENDETLVVKDTTQTSVSWEIQVGDIDLKNIRFVYSDPHAGIFLKQSLKKAAIDFETFSILQKQIDVKLFEIEKSDGFISITSSEKDTTDANSTTQPWKFSLKNFEANDLHYVLDQPESGQRMEITLQKGFISMEKLDLKTSEIMVSKLELIEPDLVIYHSDSTINNTDTPVLSNTETPGSAEFAIAGFAWSVLAEKIEVKDGTFQYKNTAAETNPLLQKWLPVNDFNISLKNIRLSPAEYGVNLEKISFNLNHLIEVKSGAVFFESDSLQKLKLTVDLAATIIKEKQTLFAKDENINFSTAVSGALENLQLEKLKLTTTSGIDFEMAGYLTQILKLPETGCNLAFRSKPITRNQIKELVGLIKPDIKLPNFRPVDFSGSIKNSILNPVFNLSVKSGSGNMGLAGNFNIDKMKGNLLASFNDVLLNELMGDVYPEKITGKIQLNGGLNQSKMPEGEASIEIDSVLYKNKITRNLAVHAVAQNNEAGFSVTAIDSALNCSFEGRLEWGRQKSYSGSLSGIFDIDLFGMKLYSEPFSGKGNINASFGYAPGEITALVSFPDFLFRTANDTVTINETEFSLNSTDSLIESTINSDFLAADFKSKASFADFKNAFDSTRLETAINLDSTNFINLNAISNLESFSLHGTVRYDSVFNLFFPDSVLNFSNIIIEIQKPDVKSRVEATISTQWLSYNIVKSFNPQLQARIEKDKLSFHVNNDSIVAREVKFGKSGFNLELLPSSIIGEFKVDDKNFSILHQIGFVAERDNDQIIFKSATPEWSINRIPWTLTTQQFLTFNKSSKTFAAGLDMHFVDKRFSIKGNSDDLIELDMHNIELKNLAIPGIIGFVPDGKINANVKYRKNEYDNLELNMEMLGMKWGNIQFNRFAAIGHLIADSTGIQESELLITADDSLSLLVEMETNSAANEFQVKSKFRKLHFQLFEPFISEFASQLHGSSNGEIVITKKSDQTAMNGEIGFNKFGFKVIPLKTWLTIPDNKIKIEQNQFVFNNFTVIDSLQKPLTVNGKIGFENSENIWLDLKVEANDILLMNTSEKDNPEFFGSVIVNSILNINGSVFSPEIRGNIDLESGTNLTYQLIQDLSVAKSQTDVVFAIITDSLQIIMPDSTLLKKITHMPMIETAIRINPKSIFNVKISDLYDVDITISGDGLLNYNMLPNNTMSLNGLYEIKSGDCKLKITGWPRKDFKITSGSSFRWSGNVENPDLNLEATTRVKGSYLNPIDNKSRVVDFIVSMQLKNQLSELKIVFAIQSEDQYITSVLSSLSDDEIMRQAVNLLLFETIDLPGIESSSNYMASQINSFWESQLNSLTKTTLKNIDLSFGIDTYNQTTSTGAQEKTSFTYEMERKFMNDRATVKLSGKLNDYNESAYQTNSIFENFIFEYALDNHDSKYLKLYQKRDYEDMLEGEMVKYGVGFLYRKNYKKLSDIWNRKRMPKQNKTKK